MYKIKDPTFFMNVIRVDPEVDRGLVTNAKGNDGKIRIHTQSWRTFTETVASGNTVFNYTLPISVSSLKAVFFGLRDTLTGTSANKTNHTANFKRKLTDYQFWVDGNPIPAQPVQVTAPYGEAVNELMRAWHVRLNDADFPTQLAMEDIEDTVTASTFLDSNLPFGLELESFSGKSGTIESGINVLNSNISFRMNFSTTANEQFYCTFYCLYGIFLVIDPETGISTVEF